MLRPGVFITLVVGLYLAAKSVCAQRDVQQLYEAAQQARAAGDLTGAESRYREVIRRAPELANAHHNLGIVLFMERKYAEGAAELGRAVHLNPRHAESHFMLGLARYELYQPEQAAHAFQAALHLNPGDTNALLYLGKAQLQMRDYRAAAQTFEKLCELKPKDPDVLYNLSLSHMKLTLDGINRLGAVAPQSYQFFLLMAQDAESRNFDDEAIKDYEQALRLAVSHEPAGVHYALGRLYAKSGKAAEATAEFQKELKLNPYDSLSLWRLGEVLSRGDPQQARPYLERAIALNPQLAQAALAYGRVLAQLGETRKAIGEFQRVVSLAPEEHTVYYHLFKAYRQLGQTEEAKKELALFQEMARKRSERIQEAARRLMDLDRTGQAPPAELEPGFSPQREPVHQ